MVEISVIVGFRVRPKILFFRLPTIGVGYRLTDVSGFTIRIGGDRIVRLARPMR